MIFLILSQQTWQYNVLVNIIIKANTAEKPGSEDCADFWSPFPVTSGRAKLSVGSWLQTTPPYKDHWLSGRWLTTPQHDSFYCTNTSYINNSDSDNTHDQWIILTASLIKIMNVATYQYLTFKGKSPRSLFHNINKFHSDSTRSHIHFSVPYTQMYSWTWLIRKPLIQKTQQPEVFTGDQLHFSNT